MLASLRSNSGDHELSIEFESVVECAHESGIQATVRLKGVHWDGDHIHPLSVSVAGLWLRVDDLVAMSRHISKWNNRPLELLIADDLDGEFKLCRLPGQVLDLIFGARPDVISESHPVISIKVAGGRLQSEYWFVTDQSCLRLFVEEMAELLNRVGK